MIREPEWPKGMEPLVEASAKNPAPLTLADGNYVGAIRQALNILPVEIRVDKCLVLERASRPPEVRLTLTILGEKEGENDEREHFELQSREQDICTSRAGWEVQPQRAGAD
jgi:hypothetical protein